VSTLRDLIRKIDFFEPLDDKIVNQIARLCIPREYSAGDHVVRQGDPGLGLYFMTGGRVKVEIEANLSKTVIAELEAGSFFGELSIIDNNPRSASVICLTDAACLLLTRDSFQKLVEKHPEILIPMVRALAARLRKADQRIGLHIAAANESAAGGAPSSGTSWPRQEDRARAGVDVEDGPSDSVRILPLVKSLAAIPLTVLRCLAGGRHRDAGSKPTQP
jgi:CRP-like cAMP-binding protein